MIKVGVNGFGRIGRNVVRAALEGKDDIQFVAVNDLTDAATLAYLLKYDSVHRTLDKEVSSTEKSITVDGKEIRVFSSPDPAEIPWGDLGVEMVVESSGRFTSKDKASRHLRKGVEHVIISAPSKDADVTICMGVNERDFDASKHKVLSNASCTTNCVAPLAKVLDDLAGIESGFMTTIHAYTNDQSILDQPHKDLRRARAAAINLIPTSTGAAKAIGLVLPHLKGKVDGISVRAPVPTGSLTDLVVTLGREVTKDEVNAAYAKAAEEGSLAPYLQYTDDPLVSTDIVGNPHSCIVDSQLTMAHGRTAKVFGWYDNEWGYSCRLVDLVGRIAV
jgi:glyceraldehyde 3-phosphate dehydrogenase